MRLFYFCEVMSVAVAVTLVCSALNCVHPAPPPESVEAAYGAALLRCVDKSDTREQSESCREAVNEKYGRALDGGVK